MKEYILKTDLTVQKIQEDCAELDSWASKYYYLHNGIDVRFYRCSGKITNIQIEASSDKVRKEDLIEIFTKFGYKSAKISLMSFIEKLVSLVSQIPYLSIDTKLFQISATNDVKEIAENYFALLNLTDSSIVKISTQIYAEKVENDKISQAIVDYINLKGYRVEQSQPVQETPIF